MRGSARRWLRWREGERKGRGEERMRWQQPLVLPHQVSEAATWGWQGRAGDRDGGRSGGTDPICPRSSSSTDAASIPACPDTSRHFPGETRRVWHRSTGRRECGVQGNTHHPTLSAWGRTGTVGAQRSPGSPCAGLGSRKGWLSGWATTGWTHPALCCTHMCAQPPHTHTPPGVRTREPTHSPAPPPPRQSQCCPSTQPRLHPAHPPRPKLSPCGRSSTGGHARAVFHLLQVGRRLGIPRAPAPFPPLLAPVSPPSAGALGGRIVGPRPPAPCELPFVILCLSDAWRLGR